MMKSAALVRAGSIPPVHHQRLTRCPSHAGIIPSSPGISFLSSEDPNRSNGFHNMRRSYSVDADLMNTRTPLIRDEWHSFPDFGATLELEEEEESLGIGSGKGNNDDSNNYGGNGNGNGNGKGVNNNNNNNNSNNKMGEYYQNMLKSNPGDPLLLGNYAKHLHQVEKNVGKAEEYFGRAILADPGDGQVLSLYGNLIWETSKDEHRAKLYFDQALHASPNDCMVLGSYAHFLWEAEDEEEEDGNKCQDTAFPAMVGVH